MYIQPYNSKPSLNPLGKSLYNVFYGVEIEVEVDNETFFDKEAKAKEITEKIKEFAITKHDGSLIYGFEICSSPASLDYHSYAWTNFFQADLLNGLKAYETKTAGMHVHISRAPLTSLQIGKIVSFIHNPLNVKFIRRIAQRDSNKYNDYSKLKKVSAVHDKFLSHEGRYTAVNLLNKNTVEIRIFKSNLKQSSFLRNIEFCAALVDFTWPSVKSITQAQSYKQFSKHVSQNRKLFPHLYSYLVKNKYIIDLRSEKYLEMNIAKSDVRKKETDLNLKKKQNKNSSNKSKNKYKILDYKYYKDHVCYKDISDNNSIDKWVKNENYYKI